QVGDRDGQVQLRACQRRRRHHRAHVDLVPEGAGTDLTGQYLQDRPATVDAAGVPHLVPVTFALAGDEAFTAVDAKPKRTSRLKRLDNVRTTGRACMLADFYDEDWSRLWWVRADATAQVLGPGPQAARGLALLAGKYRQYADAAPAGAVIALLVTRWTGWAAS
ncbi:MAG: TIGR03668 family PPOX class F420-dependent oxidoreductase, partial [Frankiaceae bacterium]